MHVTDEQRRLCAGDWVRLIGPGASIRGLGKVVDADYDSEDGNLRLAQIEFARGAHWFWPGDVRRIGAEEEVRLCEAALEAVLMPEPARDRIKAALLDPPRPATARSLGLLDLLWSLLGSLPNERAVKGLARFFDEGGPEKRFVEPRPTPIPPPSRVFSFAPPPSPRPAEPPPYTYSQVEGGEVFDPIATTIRPPRYAPAPAEPSASPKLRSGMEGVFDALLGKLNHGNLTAIAAKVDVLIDRRMAIRFAREKVRLSVTIQGILAALSPTQIAASGDELGLIGIEDLDLLKLRIYERAAPRTATDLLKHHAVSPTETHFLLMLLTLEELRGLAASMGLTAAADDARQALIASIIAAVSE